VSNDAWALAVVAVAVLAVSRRARLAAWAVLRGAVGVALAVAALVVERRRGLERPARQLPPGHVWHCTIYVERGKVMRALASGTVTGPWVTAGDVEREAMARWVETHGWPSVGRLCARAKPMAVAAST
jgi:hypothetical protein